MEQNDSIRKLLYEIEIISNQLGMELSPEGRRAFNQLMGLYNQLCECVAIDNRILGFKSGLSLNNNGEISDQEQE